MNNWNFVDSDSDITSLLNAAFGFHDSQLTDMVYFSGDHKIQNGIAFGTPENHVLYVRFVSFWYQSPLELCFKGVRRYQIAGFQKNYSSEILDCYLKFHEDLYKFSSERLIVSADGNGFDPYNNAGESLMAEPMFSYIVAEQLYWRFVEESDGDTFE